MYKVAFKTIGCRLNQYETDAIASDFHKAGYQIVPFNEKADIYIINTCTVTAESDHKTKNYINNALKRKENSIVAVIGCMTQTQKEWLQNKEVDLIIDNYRKFSTFHIIDSIIKGETNLETLITKNNRFGFNSIEKGLHTRNFIKIQDGCDNYCSYCIIPYVRGLPESRPIQSILDEINNLLEIGYKEVVLTGINISRYNYENYKFSDLIEKILDIKKEFRLRISSIEPEGIDEKLIDLFENEKLCPHLHICLQSGSDRILKLMNRKYTIKDFYEIIESIRKKYPLFNFTTDVIVGFPGETEEDFRNTYNTIKEIGFSHVHTFPYSARKGTLAYNYKETIPNNLKEERCRIIRELSNENKLKYRKQFIGKTQQVLIEKVKENLSQGYGQHYIPIKINKILTHNTIVEVIINEIDTEDNFNLIGLTTIK